jgi:hypothetical protein
MGRGRVITTPVDPSAAALTRKESMTTVNACANCEQTGETIRSVFTPEELGALLAFARNSVMNKVSELAKAGKLPEGVLGRGNMPEEFLIGLSVVRKLVFSIPAHARDAVLESMKDSGMPVTFAPCGELEDRGLH